MMPIIAKLLAANCRGSSMVVMISRLTMHLRILILFSCGLLRSHVLAFNSVSIMRPWRQGQDSCQESSHPAPAWPGKTSSRSQRPFHLNLMKVTIRIVGRKPGSSEGTAWLDQGVQMYQQRLDRQMTLVTEWHKSNDALCKNIQADANKGHAIIVLDPSTGKQYLSEDFADQFYQWMQQGGSRVVFVIGGAEGLPKEILEVAAYPKISLSKLTFTHQFARLLLVEQIYRAYEISRGSDYHK